MKPLTEIGNPPTQGDDFTPLAGIGASPSMPFLKPLASGQWGTPAELYNAYRAHGLSQQDARMMVLHSLSLGSHHGMKENEVNDEVEQNSPQY